MTGRLRGGLLTALSRVVSQGAQFATFMVAAASMGPEDFGVFALVSAAVVILNALAGSGWPEYAMQWSGEPAQQRRVLAMAIFSGFAMTLAALALSLLVPYVTTLPDAAPLLQLFALTIVIHAAANTCNGILIWQHQLTAAAWTIIAAELVSMTVSITFLLLGHGVYALAWGKISGALCWLVLGLAFARLRPDFRLTKADLLEIGHFAANIMSVRMLINLRSYLGTILVGFFLGAGGAGFYRAAQRLSGAVGEIIGEPTRVLAWSLFREARDGDQGTAGFQRVAEKMLPLVTALALPLFATLAFASEDLVIGLLGPDWQPAGRVLAALAVAGAIYAYGAAMEPILSLAGAVREMPRMVTVNLLISTVVTLSAGPFGLLPIAAAQILAGLINVWWNARILKDRANVHLWQALRRALPQTLALAVSLLATGLVFWLAVSKDLPALMRFFLFSFVNLGLFYAILVKVDPSFKDAIKRTSGR